LLGDIRKDLELPQLELILCKPNREQIAILTEAYEKVYSPRLVGVSELKFKIPYYVIENGIQIVNPNWDLIKGDYLILLNNQEYFIIQNPKNSGGEIDYKEILAYSQQHELSRKIVKGYKGEKTIYNIANPEESILTYIISLAPSWNIGSIDGDLLNIYRYFDIAEKSLLEFIDDVQKTFQCIFQYDTINKVINVIKVENLSNENRGLYISEGNYLKTINQEIKFDEIITRLYAYGKDDLSINSVNPTGTSFIEDYSYYRNTNYMSQSLLDALDAYDALIATKTNEFQNLLTQLSEYQVNLQTKNNELDALKLELKLIQDNMDVCIQTGELSNGHDYTYWRNQEVAKNQQINSKNNEIANIQSQIDSVNANINDLKNQIKKENNFTAEQLKELDFFVKEKTWRDSNYYDVDELYEDAKKMLQRLNQPPLEFEIDVVDLFSILECQHDWDKIKIGTLINIEYNKFGINEIPVRLIGYDQSENNTLKLYFSNKSSVDDPYIYLTDLLNSAISAGNTLNIERFKYGKYYDSERNELLDFINSELDTAKNAVLAGKNQDVRIDDRGILLQDKNNPNEYIRIINNVIAMTKDGGQTFSLAITPQGVIGERLIGKILLGSNLYIEDSTGEFNITGNLLTIKDNSNPKKIRVQLGKYDSTLGKYGLRLYNKAGTATVLDEDGMLQCWGDSIVDNVDSTHKLRMNFYIPDNVISIRQLKLFFTLEPFRAYETSAASGGGWASSTVSGGGEQISSLNSDYDYDLLTFGANWLSSTDGVQAYTPRDGISNHYHSIPTGGNTNSDGEHVHNVIVYSHYHQLNPTGLQHTHIINLPYHAHAFSVPDHTHNINYGIYESTTATNVKVYVDGVERLNNGGAGYSTNQSNLDLTQWITTSGWHYIELSSSTLGRINAAYFIQAFLGI